MDFNTGALIALIGCIVGLAGWLRNHDTDNERETSNLTTVIVKLENIRGSISDLKLDLKRTAEDLQSIDRRLTVVEESVKQAHNRINEIKGEN